ncbi:hypothetical protein HZS_2043 [Henneguya salminicola]|nr:hypothetical protein HZS_2043 [Henneguya salminicola]
MEGWIKENCHHFLLSKNIISRSTICSVCLNLNISVIRKWRCTKKSCRKQFMIFRRFFIQNRKLKSNKLLEFSYYGLKTNCNDCCMFQ